MKKHSKSSILGAVAKVAVGIAVNAAVGYVVTQTGGDLSKEALVKLAQDLGRKAYDKTKALTVKKG